MCVRKSAKKRVVKTVQCYVRIERLDEKLIKQYLERHNLKLNNSNNLKEKTPPKEFSKINKKSCRREKIQLSKKENIEEKKENFPDGKNVKKRTNYSRKNMNLTEKKRIVESKQNQGGSQKIPTKKRKSNKTEILSWFRHLKKKRKNFQSKPNRGQKGGGCSVTGSKAGGRKKDWKENTPVTSELHKKWNDTTKEAVTLNNVVNVGNFLSNKKRLTRKYICSQDGEGAVRTESVGDNNTVSISDNVIKKRKVNSINSDNSVSFKVEKIKLLSYSTQSRSQSDKTENPCTIKEKCVQDVEKSKGSESENSVKKSDKTPAVFDSKKDTVHVTNLENVEIILKSPQKKNKQNNDDDKVVDVTKEKKKKENVEVEREKEKVMPVALERNSIHAGHCDIIRSSPIKNLENIENILQDKVDMEEILSEVSSLVKHLHETYRIIQQLVKDMPKNVELASHFKRVITAQQENFRRDIWKNQEAIMKGYDKMMIAYEKPSDVAREISKRTCLSIEDVLNVVSRCILVEDVCGRIQKVSEEESKIKTIQDSLEKSASELILGNGESGCFLENLGGSIFGVDLIRSSEEIEKEKVTETDFAKKDSVDGSVGKPNQTERPSVIVENKINSFDGQVTEEQSPPPPNSKNPGQFIVETPEQMTVPRQNRSMVDLLLHPPIYVSRNFSLPRIETENLQLCQLDQQSNGPLLVGQERYYDGIPSKDMGRFQLNDQQQNNLSSNAQKSIKSVCTNQSAVNRNDGTSYVCENIPVTLGTTYNTSAPNFSSVNRINQTLPLNYSTNTSKKHQRISPSNPSYISYPVNNLYRSQYSPTVFSNKNSLPQKQGYSIPCQPVAVRETYAKNFAQKSNEMPNTPAVPTATQININEPNEPPGFQKSKSNSGNNLRSSTIPPKKNRYYRLANKEKTFVEPTNKIVGSLCNNNGNKTSSDCPIRPAEACLNGTVVETRSKQSRGSALNVNEKNVVTNNKSKKSKELFDPTVPQILVMKDYRLQAGATFKFSESETPTELENGNQKESVTVKNKSRPCNQNIEAPKGTKRTRKYICALESCKNVATHVCECCLSVTYCSDTCQVSHWKVKHRKECAELRKLYN